jgi:hypothetical protein
VERLEERDECLHRIDVAPFEIASFRRRTARKNPSIIHSGDAVSMIG